MPRTTKEVNKKIKEETEEPKKKISTKKKSTTAAKSSKKTTPAKKETTTKKTSVKEESIIKKKVASVKKALTVKKEEATPVKKDSTTNKKKATSTKKVSTAKKEKTTSAKKASTAKKEKATPVKKESKSKTTSVVKKNSTTKKSTASKTTSKKAAKSKSPSKKTTLKNQSPKIDILEYYDLPYRYNQTVVKVLAQTPNILFVYWDISDDDRKSYVEQFGDKFFENTKPVLIITNTTMNYTFEIEINDFANCWYFNINDEKCEYLVELGRRPKENVNTPLPNNYLYITSSNKIESPNGHILFEKELKTIFYRNVKTNEIYSKDIANLNFLTRIGRIYKIFDIYQKLYKNDELIKPNNNPSSKFF